LLQKDPKKRLGANGDIEEVNSHPFFAEFKWDKLMKKQIPPRYKPVLKSNGGSK